MAFDTYEKYRASLAGTTQSPLSRDAWTKSSLNSANSTSSSTPSGTVSSPSSPSQNDEWYLSSWSMGSDGKWATQPTLTINGQQYKFNSPQEYIDKMSGLTGSNVSTFTGQLQKVVPQYTAGQQTATPTSTTGANTANTSVTNNLNNYLATGKSVQEAIDWGHTGKTPGSPEWKAVDEWANGKGYTWTGSTWTPTAGTTTSTTSTATTGSTVKNGYANTAPKKEDFPNNADYVTALNEFNATGSYKVPTGYNANDSMFDFLKGSDYFKNLTPDQQSAVKYQYYLMRTGTSEEQQRFVDAMDLAAKSTNINDAQTFRQVADTLTNYVTDKTQDYSFKEQRLQRNINEINSKISDASIDEQAALSKQKLAYEVDLDNTRNLMAGRGLSSSSIRNKAENILDQQNQGIVTSIQRQKERSVRSYELEKANQGQSITEAQTEKDRLMRDKFRELENTYGTDIAKQYGSQFGQTAAGEKSASYIDPATGKMTTGTLPIAGTYKDTRAQDILTRTNSLLGITKPISFPQ